ncbi:MAG: extensin family protein [Myxococcales bacterium]|nr:extensin family protein [Myxococcales bacterium]
MSCSDHRPHRSVPLASISIAILLLGALSACTSPSRSGTEADSTADTLVVADTENGVDSGGPDLMRPDTAPGVDSATDSADESDAPDTSVDTTGSEERKNDGFIGGACTSNADCAYDGGICQLESDGFPGGHCTKECTKFCPDSPDADALGTFCIAATKMGGTSGGLCVVKCNFGAYPDGGCPQGYHCEVDERIDGSANWGVCVVGSEPKWTPSECQKQLIARGETFEIGYNYKSTEGTSGSVCDVKDPVHFGPVMSGVRFVNGNGDAVKLYGRCALALAVSKTAEWLRDEGVYETIHYGTYNCRTIAGTTTVSQHGLGNAIDIAGVRLVDSESSCGTSADCMTDGVCENNKCKYSWTVLDDWERGVPNPVTVPGIFLHDLAFYMFDASIFVIILTPEYNEDHYNHFHVDLTEGASPFISK